jgi:hypothetical protein
MRKLLKFWSKSKPLPVIEDPPELEDPPLLEDPFQKSSWKTY